MANPGFYKFENNNLLRFAATGVYAPNFTLLAAEQETYTYPVDGWRWFNSQDAAEQFFEINGQTSAQWVAFGAAIAGDAVVNALVATAAQAAPVLHLMLGVGLGQAAQGDPQTFLAAWSAASAANLLTEELVDSLVAMGETYDLPESFLTAIAAVAPTP